MKDISEYTVAELQEELAQRKIASETDRPQERVSPDYTALKNICRVYIDDLYSQGWADDDFPHYIYEAAMSALYGSDVWEYINSRELIT